HVSLLCVGDLAKDVFVGRIYVGERPGLAVDELAVDHHLRLESHWCFSHGSRFRPVAWAQIASRGTLRAAISAAEAPEQRTPSPAELRSNAPRRRAWPRIGGCPK